MQGQSHLRLRVIVVNYKNIQNKKLPIGSFLFCVLLSHTMIYIQYNENYSMSKLHRFQNGFTLIELLVVITIIGILASVVVSSLSRARDKGTDASIQQTINNMRGAAELYYDSNLSYINMCSDTTIQEAMSTVDALNKAGTVTCVDGSSVTNRWALEVQLVAVSGTYYCVDNQGTAAIYLGSTISNASGSADAICGP